ncbi:methionyl-tRNA synthetase, partial [Moorena producens 3L]
QQAHYVVSTDDNQSYVDTTARRLGIEVTSLINQSRTEIRDSLSSYDIAIDHFGNQDASYREFVQAFFERLYSSGLVEVAEMQVFYDKKTDTYPIESFISGFCPNCLSYTCSGICESCGHPNSAIDLLEVQYPGLEILKEPRLVLKLEEFRSELEQYLLGMETHRPALKHLISSLLDQPMTPFPLSYKMNRGISIDFALSDQKLNVWAEMYPGHIYFLKKSAGQLSNKDEYVQFLGFDNSYFYVFVHFALGIAAQKCGFDWPLPRGFITNQFYYLGSSKFSTSKGNLIWARDLVKDYEADIIRLFLALHGPEFQEANFSLIAFEKTVSEIARKINDIVEVFNAKLTSMENGDDYKNNKTIEKIISILSKPLDLKDYSSSILAQRALNIIDFLRESLQHGNHSLLPFVPVLLVMGLDPFCPKYTQSIRDKFELSNYNWEELVPCCHIQHELPKLLVKR